MKNLKKFLSVALAGSVLLLAACSKKPVRDPNAGANQMSNQIDPNSVAIPSDVAPGTNLETRTDTGVFGKSVVEPVYFDFDRSAVPERERSKLEAAVKWLKENADKRMVLEGHCDWRGTAEYNLGLGDRRANAVRRYLEHLGVDSKRLEILSKGSTEAKQGGTDAEWAKDRRVDFIELTK
ncbi:MAG TPA: OmpA family protein [Acidobacteriota bacterium]|nr:OmpA family protein [Acidobacteriota bacterium]